MHNQEIVIRIRKVLREKGMSQRELAASLEKKEAEISRWMSGRVGISDQNLKRIEAVLEISLSKESLAEDKLSYLRIGVIGTGSIACRFAEEAAYVDNVYIAAAYNPNREELHAYCKEYGIDKEAESLEELLSACDAIYIASPYYTHYEYVVSSLLAGKHVLCETPLTENYKQVQNLYALAEKKSLVLMPALKTAYCPSFVNIVEDALSGVIGDVVDVSATVTTLLPQSKTVGYNNERLLDNAYYALLIVLKVLGSEVKKTTAYTRRDGDKLLYLDACMQYDDAVAHVKAGTGVKAESSLVIAGTSGYIYVPSPWWKPDYFEIRYENPYDNKKLYFPYESSGLRYELQCFVDHIGLKSTARNVTKSEILKMGQIIDKIIN